MSADDWIECPFCKKERDKLLDKLFKELSRKKYDRLLELVEEYNLNVNGIYYVIDNGYLENNDIPDIESDMQLCTMGIDYEYDINEKECYFIIIFECEICGFKEVLEQKKQFADVVVEE